MGQKLYLIMDCFCIFLSFLTVIGNSVIIYLFFTKRLDSRRNLRIVLLMAITDIIFAASIMPQIYYMTIMWEPTHTDYDPYVMAALGWPLPMFLKIACGLNAGAAAERILALYFPIAYRKLDHVQCSNVLISLCTALGSFDTALCIYTFEFEKHLNCSSIGCFVTDMYRDYWGVSNMTCGIVIIVLSMFVFVKVQKLSRHTVLMGATPGARKTNMVKALSFKLSRIATQKFRHANHTACGILISTLFCLTIPSLLVTATKRITGYSMFNELGSFYVASLLMSGSANCLIFLMLNGSIRGRIDPKMLSECIVTTPASSKPLNPSNNKTMACIDFP